MGSRAALVGFLLLFSAPGCGGKKAGDPRTRTSGSLTAHFTPEPNPPHVGHDSGFAFTLTEGGNPVAGASVQLATFFKGLNQTGPTATMFESAPGRYEARDLSTGMNGRWEAVVTVSRPNQPDARFTFPFHVAK